MAKKRWWSVTIDDGEYTHSYKFWAASVSRIEDDRFDKGFGLKVDAVLVDFSFGSNIEEIK